MFSWVALDRFVEKERAKGAAFRKQSMGKVLRSDAKQLTDDDLLAKLRSFDIEMDRPSLEQICLKALSAEEIAMALVCQRNFHGREVEMESDWIWVSLTALWQRWFPDQPCFELLDDKIVAGYQLTGAEELRPLATSGLRHGVTCSVFSIREGCNRSARSMNCLEDRNFCSIGFRTWKASCGRRGWRIGSF